jgi:nitrous oxidase accessory protein NosD
MFAGVVHQEGAEGPAVRQVEEEDFSGAVLGVQVEEPQEVGLVGLEAGGLADLEVVEVGVEVGLAVVENVEVGVSEGRSSAACLFL